MSRRNLKQNGFVGLCAFAVFVEDLTQLQLFLLIGKKGEKLPWRMETFYRKERLGLSMFVERVVHKDPGGATSLIGFSV